MIKLKWKIIIVCLMIFLPEIVNAQKNNVNKKYTHTVRPHPKSVYRVYDLTLNSDNTFLLRKYYEEFCYNHSDTIKGKWVLKNKILSFPEINYNQQIRSNKIDTISNNRFVVIEKDIMFKEASKDEIHFTALDSNLNLIKLFNPIKTTIINDDTEYKKFIKEQKDKSFPVDLFKEQYLKQHLISYCEMPKETMIIIYHGKQYSNSTTDIFIEEGININIKTGKNLFVIYENPRLINSSVKFEVTDKGNLKSIKPIDSDIGHNQKHEYKEVSNK